MSLLFKIHLKFIRDANHRIWLLYNLPEFQEQQELKIYYAVSIAIPFGSYEYQIQSICLLLIFARPKYKLLHLIAKLLQFQNNIWCPMVCLCAFAQIYNAISKRYQFM